jgi:hypothetical protein
MTSRSLARALALSSTVALFGWSFFSGCGGHPLGASHPSGSAGKSGGSPGTAGTVTGSGPGTAGVTTIGVAGSTSVGAAGAAGTGSGGAILGTAGSGGSPSPACMQAQSDYDGLHDMLSGIYATFGCKADSDCVAVFEPGNCGPFCPDIALPAAVATDFVANLMGDASVCNGVCPPRSLHSCPANPAVCKGGQCALAGIIGAGGTTGSTGTAGVSGGAGQGGTAGAIGCGGPCMPVQCKTGYVSVVDPAISCCPICRPLDCSTTQCAPIDCPTGSHPEIPTGQCCATCVMGFSQACNTAQAQYSTNRQALLEKYGEPACKQDSDCRLVYEGNACVSNCGEALPVVTAGSFEMNISSEAAACDAACPPIPKPPCVQQVAVCSNGMCTAVPGGGGLGLN